MRAAVRAEAARAYPMAHSARRSESLDGPVRRCMARLAATLTRPACEGRLRWGLS